MCLGGIDDGIGEGLLGSVGHEYAKVGAEFWGVLEELGDLRRYLPLWEIVACESEREKEERRTDLVDCVWLAVIAVEDGEELSVDVGFAGFFDLADVLDGGLDQLGIEHLKVGRVVVVWRGSEREGVYEAGKRGTDHRRRWTWVRRRWTT